MPWDLLAVGALGLLGLLVTLLGRKGSSRPSPVVPGPSPVQQAADAQAVEDVSKAERLREEQARAAQADHDDGLHAVVVELEKKTELVKDDGAETNSVLIDIGKQVRGAGGT